MTRFCAFVGLVDYDMPPLITVCRVFSVGNGKIIAGDLRSKALSLGIQVPSQQVK